LRVGLESPVEEILHLVVEVGRCHIEHVALVVSLTSVPYAARERLSQSRLQALMRIAGRQLYVSEASVL
jgi:hypothetical protein